MSAQEDAEDRRALAANIAMGLLSHVGVQFVDLNDAKEEFLDLMRAIDSCLESGWPDELDELGTAH